MWRTGLVFEILPKLSCSVTFITFHPCIIKKSCFIKLDHEQFNETVSTQGPHPVAVIEFVQLPWNSFSEDFLGLMSMLALKLSMVVNLLP